MWNEGNLIMIIIQPNNAHNVSEKEIFQLWIAAGKWADAEMTQSTKSDNVNISWSVVMQNKVR